MLKKLCLIRQVCCPCTFLLANFSTLSGRKTTAFPTCIVPKLAITRIKRKAGILGFIRLPFVMCLYAVVYVENDFFFNDRVATTVSHGSSPTDYWLFSSRCYLYRIKIKTDLSLFHCLPPFYALLVNRSK